MHELAIMRLRNAALTLAAWALAAVFRLQQLYRSWQVGVFLEGMDDVNQDADTTNTVAPSSR